MLLYTVVNLLIIIFSLYANAGELDNPKYNKAINVSIDAAMIQSGLKPDLLKIQRSLETKATKFLRDNGLATVATVGAVLIPIVYYQKVRIPSGNFLLEGKKDSISLTYTLQF